MSSYTPKPGSVAYRILGWLEAQGREKEFNSSQIANALDIDTRAVQSLMQQSLAAGLVFRRQKDRTHPLAPYWWSLTNHGVRQREFTPNPVGWMNVKKDADEVPVFCEVSGRTKSPRMADADSGVGVSAPMTTPSPTVTNLPGQPNPPQGDQPRSERGREVMEPEACESAAGRGTLSHTASPGVGPMGAGQPADAGPTGEDEMDREMRAASARALAAGQGLDAALDDAAKAIQSRRVHIDEQRREVDAQFAASLRAAMNAVHAPPEPAPLAFRAARFSDGTLATERDGIVVAVYSAAEVDAIQKLLGART